MSETMVERVARRLHAAHYERGRGLAPDWSALTRHEQEMWMFSARAALAAMREPTEGMVAAGWPHTADPCWRDHVADAWRAMIDKALEEG